MPKGNQMYSSSNRSFQRKGEKPQPPGSQKGDQAGRGEKPKQGNCATRYSSLERFFGDGDRQIIQVY